MRNISFAITCIKALKNLAIERMVLVKKRKIARILSAVILGNLISVSPYALAEETEIPSFYEDFEGYEIGEIPSYITIDASAHAGSGIIDDGTGNKVFMLKYNRNASYKNMYMNLGETYNTGRYNYSYRFKIVNSDGGDWYDSFMTLNDGTNNIMTRKITKGTQFFNNTANTYDDIEKYKDSNGYYNITSTLDLDNLKHYLPVKDPYGRTSDSLSAGTFKRIRIRSNHDFSSGIAAVTNDPENADFGVIYIDDIEIELDRLAITDMNPSEGDKVSILQDVNVTFDEDIKSVDKAKVEITEKLNVWEEGKIKEITNILSEEEYNLTYSGKMITISFPDKLEYAAEYGVKINKGAVTPTSKMSVGYDAIKFTTEEILDGDIGISDGEFYTADIETEKYTLNLTMPQNTEYSLYLSMDGGESFSDFTAPAELEAGKYDLVVVAIKNGKTQAKLYNFEVINAVAPYAEDIGIEGDMIVGNTLTGKYTFRDDNTNDTEVTEGENSTAFRWKRLDKETGEYVYIKDGEDYYNKKTYTLTEKDIDTSLRFVVIPVSSNEPNPMTEFESEEISGPHKPIAENVVMKELEDGTLEITFQYKDVNAFPEGEHIYSWYRAKGNDINSEKTKIEGANNSTYKLTDEDVNCYIFASVTPKKTVAPEIGEEAFATTSKMAAFAPEARNVMLTGKALVGSPIGVNFEFYDLNDDIEGSTEFEWYVNGEVSGKERSLQLTSQMNGKEVYCVVTPVSAEYPYKGEPVTSETVKVTKKSGGGSVSVSGGGSPGGGFIPVIPGNNNTTNTNKNEETNNPTDNAVGFSDISGHWAKENINKASKLGYVKGVSESEFAPDKNITRAEIAAIFVRCLKLEATKNAEYSDVSENEWYHKNVSAITEAGYMAGFNGSFRPNDNITREELSSIAMRILSEIEAEGGFEEFADNSEISDWAKKDIEKAVRMGIMLGRENNIFAPRANVTRAEAVTVVLRILESLEV